MTRNKETSSKAELTRQAICDAAYTLFMEQGYAATSMRQIAARAGVALGGIYNHFNSKETIFVDVLREHHFFYLLIPLIRSASGDTLEEFVSNAARNSIEGLKQQPEFLNLILIELIEFNRKHVPELFEKIFPDALSIIDCFHRYKDEMLEYSDILMLRVFMGMFLSYFITESLLEGLLSEELQNKSLEQYVTIFLHGIQKPKA